MRRILLCLSFVLSIQCLAQSRLPLVRFNDQMELSRQSAGWGVTILDPKDPTYAVLHSGDLIQTINGVTATKIGLIALNDTVNECNAHPVSLHVKRDNREMSLTLWCGTSAVPPLTSVKRNPYIAPGRGAPDFTLVDQNGTTASLSQHRHQWVFLNFWGTWCGPCLAEIPQLVTLSNNNKGRLTVIGLSIQDTDEKLKSYLQKHPVPYQIVNSGTRKSELPLKYGVATPIPGYSAPMSFLIAPNGEVVYVQNGTAENKPIVSDEVLSFLNSAK